MKTIPPGVPKAHPHAPRLAARHFPLLGVLALATGLGPGSAQALAYQEALALAEQQSPGLTAQHLQLEAAGAAHGAAAALPDPKLSIGLENLPIGGMDRWSLTRDFMTMQRLALMQEVPNQAKREARVQLAQARSERERAGLALQRLQIRQALGQAWVAAQSAERRQALLDALLAENQRLQDSLPARVAGGSAQAADVLAARQENLALLDRRDELQRDTRKARTALRRWLGTRADEALDDAPPPLAIPIEQLRAELQRHAELALYPALREVAAAELREAQAESRGDWSWELAYSRRGRQWGDMLSFQLSFDLPWQQGQRQGPLIRAKQLESQRVEAEQEEASRRHLQALEESVLELQSLERQIERLQSDGMTLAVERSALALSRYQSGKAELASVLAARAQVLEARLRLIELQAQRDGLRVRLNSLIAD
ncbi:outer membrane protein TolC [Paucibacter oligotrophus]|uniref:Outer membrane protein TolC n=1 Tax=Roseateles oligotrophus TaxID=1769250 RepID=A0A840LAY3_9BURK|nr:TolC family protein [Roseateles oligotrophus]MBB4845744.1 outer membrane protein TolC [Roseateles oligotrophus]